MLGKIFITSSGYDPELGKHVKDPYLGANPSLGACRPNVRRRVNPGDYVFTITGKIRDIPQYVMGGFQVAHKVHANDAFRLYPERRLSKRRDGQLDGNIIVNSRGKRHRLDGHNNFNYRLEDYVVGKNPITLETTAEIARGREETLDVLCALFDRLGGSPFEIIGRGARNLTEEQVCMLLDWLQSIKREVA